MTEEVPSDSSRARVVALVVSGVVVLLALIGFGLWALTRPADSAPKQTSIQPAQETTAAPLPGALITSLSAEPSATGEMSAPSTPAQAAPSTTAPAVAGAGALAFNLGGRLYISDVSGSRITPVFQASEAYAVSPDGTKVAVVALPPALGVEGGPLTGQVAVIDVATQAVTTVGVDAVGYPVSWGPDSSWFAYTAQAGEEFAVKRVQVDGSGDRVIAHPGSSPRVSRDGQHVAYVRANQPGLGDPLVVLALATGKERAVPQGDGALAWGWGTGSNLFFTKSTASSPQDWGLWRYTVGQKSSRKLGSVSIEAPAYSLLDLRVSPDGKTVFMAAGGDDHYSRLWVFDVAAERFSAIQTRRDAYPCCWADNDEILYFEGNSYQGEPSALASIKADGTDRRLIITGAQR